MRRPAVTGPLTVPLLLVGRQVRLRPKCLQDAIDDYNWRMDAELCRLDAAVQVLCRFEDYVKDYAEGLAYAGRGYHFAIETHDGRHIGNCSYFNIDHVRKEAEMGIMIGDKAHWNRGCGADAIAISLDYVFSHSDLDRIHLKTLDWNIRAQKCFEKCGFKQYGRLSQTGYDFILMEMRRAPVSGQLTDLSQHQPR